MKVIIIGAGGAVGKTAVEALAPRHEIVTVGRSSGDIQADIDPRVTEFSDNRCRVTVAGFLTIGYENGPGSVSAPARRGEPAVGLRSPAILYAMTFFPRAGLMTRGLREMKVW